MLRDLQQGVTDLNSKRKKYIVRMELLLIDCNNRYLPSLNSELLGLNVGTEVVGEELG